MTALTGTGPSAAPTDRVHPPARGRRGGRVRRLFVAGSIGFAGLMLVGFLAVTVGPRVLPYKVMYVRSGSMRPTMGIGSLAVYVPTPAAELGKGDVIAFSPPDKPGELVSHRVHKVVDGASGRAFVTKGDANAAPDAWQIPATGTGWRMVGVVPVVGYGVAAMTVPLIRFGMVALMALWAATILLLDVWRPRVVTQPTAEPARA